MKKILFGLLSFVFAFSIVVGGVGCKKKSNAPVEPVQNAILVQLNEKLATAEAVSGKNATMFDALKDIEDDGSGIATINANSDSKFVWNSKTDRFVIVNAEGEVVEGEKSDATKFDLWLVSADVEENFSTYYIGTPKEIVTTKGFDVGNVDGITSIIFTNEGTEKATFRTNSNDTTLSINTNGIAKHYGVVGKLDVQKVSTSSYHEHGKVRTATIHAGNFIVEANASVTLLVAKGTSTVHSQGAIEAYVGSAAVEGQQPALQTSTAIDENTLAIVKGETDEAVAELPSEIANATIILFKDYDENHPQVTISGNTTIYGNMTKLNALVVGDDSHVVLKNIHTTGIKVGSGTNYGFGGTLEFDGGQLDYDGEHFANGEGAAFYANDKYGTYIFHNMTVSTGTNKGIKVSKAEKVVVENCVFDARLLSDEGISGTTQDEVYNRSLSCIDIQVQNGALGAMRIEIKNNTFVNIPQGSITNNVADSDSAGAIKLKVENLSDGTSLSSVLIEGNTFTNCYRDVVVGVNIRLTTGYNNLNFPEKNPGTLKSEQNNVKNSSIYTIRNNISTHTAEEVANIGVLVVDDRRSSPSNAYAEKLGEMLGGCAVFNTYASEVITLDTTIEDVNALFAE